MMFQYWKLNDENKKLFREFIYNLADDMKKNENTIPLEPTVEDKEAAYKKSRLTSAHKTTLSASNTTDEKKKNA